MGLRKKLGNVLGFELIEDRMMGRAGTGETGLQCGKCRGGFSGNIRPLIILDQIVSGIRSIRVVVLAQ